VKCEDCGKEVTKCHLVYRTIEVDVEPAEKKEKWVKWMSMDELEKLISAEMEKYIRQRMKRSKHKLVALLREYLSEEAIREVAKSITRRAIFFKAQLVLKVLQAKDERIRGWRCIPTTVCDSCLKSEER